MLLESLVYLKLKAKNIFLIKVVNEAKNAAYLNNIKIALINQLWKVRHQNKNYIENIITGSLSEINILLLRK